MQCPRCHNQDAQMFYQIDGQYYCRQCIPFHRVFVNEERQTESKEFLFHKPISYALNFQLSPSQQKISLRLLENYQNNLNSLVLAVCGSGKTEVVFELICYALNQGHRVCYCVPRKELVIELYQRLKEAFCNVTIGLLYGGHIENVDSNFIVCTMHQLYRFENQIGFQLMIADEVDAFPYYGNDVLNEMFNRCCVGRYVKLSATIPLLKDNQDEVLIMNRRYHGYDLPVPKLLIIPTIFQGIVCKWLISHLQKKVIIYVSSIACVHKMVTYLASSFKVAGVSSQHMNNQETIQRFKDNQLDVIVSTTLLERGITIEDVQVIVYQGEKSIFDERTLTQIAGRVGRKPNHPSGKVYILASGRTKGIQQCIQNIKKLNSIDA